MLTTATFFGCCSSALKGILGGQATLLRPSLATSFAVSDKLVMDEFHEYLQIESSRPFFSPSRFAAARLTLIARPLFASGKMLVRAVPFFVN